MKSLKICLVILCLLPVRAVGTPQFSGANLFMKSITITHKTLGAKEVTIDDCDEHILSSHRWTLHKVGNTTYCISRRLKNHVVTRTYMHRLIMGSPAGKLIDHKDGNGLNNTRDNLRVCTRQENARNSRIYKRNKSGYKGVWFDPKIKKYVARLVFNGIPKHIGIFSNAIDAAKAYNSEAIKEYGKFAKPNPV